jgi:hypothetical protein
VVRRGLDLPEERGDVDPTVLRCERPKPPGRFLQLALAAGTVAATSLVPGHDDVDEPLEEVLFGRVGRAPRVLERLVRGEVLARARELEAADEVRRRP